MKKIIEKGMAILTIYLIFTAYLFFACDRIERLEEEDETVEKVNVTILYGE